MLWKAISDFKEVFLILLIGYLVNFPIFMLVLGQSYVPLPLGKVILSFVAVQFSFMMFYFFLDLVDSVFKNKLFWDQYEKIYDRDYVYSIICRSFVFTVMMTLLVVLQTNVKIFFNEFLTINNKWDQLFQSLDVFLFIGHHPWKIISSAIPHDILQLLIIILDANYMFWFCIQWFFVFDATYIAPKAYRKEALLNFVMVWVLGTQMGGLFTSGGPFFNMTNTHNVEQIQFLLDLNFSFNLMCIKAQGFLWDVFLGGTNLKSGISAFPSLHVGISYLVYRFSCKRAPVWLRRFCFIFFILIWFSSIILGWHYFIDGLGAIALVHLCERLTQLLLRQSTHPSSFSDSQKT
tara:strand:+ start:170 stop:1213 length:1044 start_codon:yes stop_codon:yes gene_type:complete